MADLGASYLKHREFAHAAMHPVANVYREIMSEQNTQMDAQPAKPVDEKKADKPKDSANG